MNLDNFNVSEKVKALDRLTNEHKAQEAEYEASHDRDSRKHQIEYARLVVGNSAEVIRQAVELVIPAVVEEDHATVVDALVVLQYTAGAQAEAYAVYMREMYPEAFEEQRKLTEENTRMLAEAAGQYAPLRAVHNPEEN